MPWFLRAFAAASLADLIVSRARSVTSLTSPTTGFLARTLDRHARFQREEPGEPLWQRRALLNFLRTGGRRSNHEISGNPPLHRGGPSSLREEGQRQSSP